MTLANTSVLVVAWTPQNSCHQCLCFQGEFQFPPVSLGGSPRSAHGSDPGSFQISVTVLGPGVCENCVYPLRMESLFPTALWVSCTQVPLAFKDRHSRASSSHAGPLNWGAHCGAQTPHSSGRTSAIVIILPCVVHPPGDVGLDCTAAPHLISGLLWLFLYIFSSGKSFLLVFRLLS